ncbi:MAG: formate/nitrite transporter family protein [Prevotella sp.]|nr:formate/nitrite transporter family protein [Prevotella sp.]
MPIRKAFLSGLFIGLGSYGYLALGGLPGAVIFAFGLISVIVMRVPLYTGMAGVAGFSQTSELLVVWFFNILGCAVMGLAAHYCGHFEEVLSPMVANRLDDSFPEAFVKAMGCGLIIDCAVYMAKEKQTMLPVIFGVPLFIVCGFYHSIADVMYLTANLKWQPEIPLYYLAIFLGNYAGCNIRRLCLIPLVHEHKD